MTAVREQVRSGLGSTRAAVLAYLRHCGEPQSVTMVAQAMGLHPNTARFHLEALAEQNLVSCQLEKRSSPGRPKQLFSAEPEPPADPPGLTDLTAALVRHLDRLGADPDDQAEAAGRHWGEELAAAEPAGRPLERVIAVLGRLGYQPTLVGDPAREVLLTPCPLAVLQAGAAEPGRLPAVCRLHRGLVDGLLADDPDLTVGDLAPWATPTTCILRLAPRRDG